jgi:hypothetical protein
VLTAAALISLAAGCSQDYGQTGSGHALCHAKDGITLTAGVIVGTVTASCEVPPTAHRMTVFLRYQLGGANPPPKGTMATKSSSAIPIPGGDVTLVVKHSCLPGTWWVEIIVAGTSPDGTPFGVSDSHKLGTVSLDDCNRR